MSFRVEHTIFNGRSFIHLKNDEEFTATIIPSLGAMLHALKVNLDGKEFNLIDGDADGEISSETAGKWFKGVKLSPWPCRIAGGRYNFKGETFKLDKIFKDGSALHGLLFDEPFNQVDEFADEMTAAVVVRHSYEGTDAGYPFPYNCEVKFALHPGRLLEVETTLLNLSDEEIPIADGWHPYFQLGGQVDEWELFFPAQAMVEFDGKLIPTGRLVPYKQFNESKRVGGIMMDNCFLLRHHEYKPVCSLRNPLNRLSLHFYTSATYPYLQIFIPPHRKSIAIENLSSPPDAFNNKMGLISLKPGNTQTFRVFYQVGVEENN